MIELLEEGIIPMNLSWRAGIGKNIPNPQSHVSNPYQISQPEEFYDGGIKLTRVNEPIKYPYGDIDITGTLIPEIDTQVTDVIEKYNGQELNGKTMLLIKEELKKTCLNIKSKYRMYLNQNFYDTLYNQCNIAYNDFSKLQEGINSLTEFIDINGKIYGNPLLIYGYFQL